MNLGRATELTKLYAKCPKCGNEFIGESEGSLIVGDSYFRRECYKCGFRVIVKEYEVTLKNSNK